MRKHNHGGSIIMTSSLSGYNANFIAFTGSGRHLFKKVLARNGVWV